MNIMKFATLAVAAMVVSPALAANNFVTFKINQNDVALDEITMMTRYEGIRKAEEMNRRKLSKQGVKGVLSQVLRGNRNLKGQKGGQKGSGEGQVFRVEMNDDDAVVFNVFAGDMVYSPRSFQNNEADSDDACDLDSDTCWGRAIAFFEGDDTDSDGCDVACVGWSTSGGGPATGQLSCGSILDTMSVDVLASEGFPFFL